MLLYRLLDNVGLTLSPSREIDLARLEDGGNTHRDTTGRHQVLRGKAHRHLLSRHGVEQDQARGGRNGRSRLVGSDVAHTSDSQQHHVDTTTRVDALLILATVVKHIVLVDSRVGREDILRSDIHPVEQPCVELADTTVLVVRLQRIVFVGIEDDDVVEAELSRLVASHHFLVDRSERGTRSQSEHTHSSVAVLLLDEFLYRIDDSLSTLLHLREDVRRDLLATCQLGTLHGRARMVVLLRHFVECNL